MNYEAPQGATYPDDFSDLERDGWFVHITAAEDRADGQPGVLLLPPGATDGVDGIDAAFLQKSPHVLMHGVPDGRDGQAVMGAVQTRTSHGGERHPAFTGDRRAHMLAQRALEVLGAARLQFAWVSDADGMHGSDNYEAYQEARKTLAPRDAAKQTWTYNMVAKPYGFTEVKGVHVTQQPIIYDARNPAIPEPVYVVNGYFEPRRESE
jgi:hypothetical protein